MLTSAAAAPLFLRCIRASVATPPSVRTYLRGVSGNLQSFHELKRSTRPLLKVPSCGPPLRCVSTAVQREDGRLVYTGSLATAVRGVKLFSYSTSGASLLLMPHMLLNSTLAGHSWALQAAFCGVVGFFTFLTPALLHYFTKGYVVRLYHDLGTDVYTAVTYSVFLSEKKKVFHQRSVRLPDVGGMFTSFYVEKVGLLVNPDLFALPQDYNHLMGYDKPFTFDTDENGHQKP